MKTKVNLSSKEQKEISMVKKDNLNENKLINFVFDSRCLFKCNHCFLWSKETNLVKIPTSRIIDALHDVKEIYGSNVTVNIGGDGMAEIEPSLLTIIRTCFDLNIKINLSTNAFLINRLFFDQLIKSGLTSFTVSLDYLSKKKHDAQRGIENSYDHVIKFIKYIESKKRSINLSIICILMKPNLDDIIPLTKWVNELSINCGIGFQAISQPFNTMPSRTWYKLKKFKNLWPGDETKLYDIIDQLIILKKQGYKISNKVSQFEAYKDYFKFPDNNIRVKCNIGKVSLDIFSNGEVRRCAQKSNFGNLIDSRLRILIKSNTYKELITTMTNCSDNCMQMINCSYEEKHEKHINH